MCGAELDRKMLHKDIANRGEKETYVENILETVISLDQTRGV